MFRTRPTLEPSPRFPKIVNASQWFALFRKSRKPQLMIEIAQILGIGIWILTDAMPHFNLSLKTLKGPKHLPSTFSFAFDFNRWQIALAIFFLLDALLILNAALYFSYIDPESRNGHDREIRLRIKRQCTGVETDIDISRSYWDEKISRYGVGHPISLQANTDLVQALISSGQQDHIEEARTLGWQLVALNRKWRGRHHQETMRCEDLLIQAHLSGGNHASGLSLAQEVHAWRTLNLPKNDREIEEVQKYLDCFFGSSGQTEVAKKSDSISSQQKKPEMNSLRRALFVFLLDCSLIVATPLRAFRAVKPILIMRRLAVATEREPRWDIGVIKEETFLILQMGILLLYSLSLVVVSIADLIFIEEARAWFAEVSKHGNNVASATSHLKHHANWVIHSFSDAVYYCIQQITLTGDLKDVHGLSKPYSLILLFTGLGIIGLFGMVFQRVFGTSLLPNQVNHTRLLEDGQMN